MSKVTPYNTSDSKKEQVADMFDNIAFRYDLLNGILSFGTHKGWRRKCVKKLKALQPKQILDVATGTGDFAIEALKLNPDKVVGVDISKGMLKIGVEKINKLRLQHKIELKLGDSESLAFADNSFDKVVAMYVASVVPDVSQLASEIKRVCKPGGTIIYLNHFENRNPLIRAAESLIQPLAKYIGFHPDFPMSEFLQKTGFKVDKAIPVNVLDYWTVLIGTNDKKTY